MHDACSEGHIEIVEMILSKDADVNAKFDDGINLRKALDIAKPCLWRRPEIASILRKLVAKTVEELKAEGRQGS